MWISKTLTVDAIRLAIVAIIWASRELKRKVFMIWDLVNADIEGARLYCKCPLNGSII